VARPQLAYAQARLSARYAERPVEADWRFFEASRDLGHCLEAVRGSAMRRYVERLNGASGSHLIETTLRDEWCALVAEVRGWVPSRWAPAVSWFALLPHLRLPEFIASGEAAPTWLPNDPAFAVLSNEAKDHAGRSKAAADIISDYALLSDPDRSGDDPSTLWRDEWRQRAPSPDDHKALDRLLDPLLTAYLETADPARMPAMTNRREGLERHLKGLFRTMYQKPVALFAALGLAALDFERLRGVLVARAVFADAAERG